LIIYKTYRTKKTPTILEQQRHRRSKETTAKKRKQQKFQAVVVAGCWGVLVGGVIAAPISRQPKVVSKKDLDWKKEEESILRTQTGQT